MKEFIRKILLFILYWAISIWPWMIIWYATYWYFCQNVNFENFCRIKQSWDRIYDFEFWVLAILLIWLIILIIIFRRTKKED